MHELHQRIRLHMEETGMSQTQMAKAIGLAASTFSQWLSGSYVGDVVKIDRQVAGYLSREEERDTIVRLPHRDTEALHRISEAASLCHSGRFIGVVFGPSGVGKTYSTRHYARHHEGVIFLEAGADWTPRATLSRLAKEIGLESISGGVHELFEALEGRLRGTSRMLIVDEAEHLPYKALELLRRLHDKTGMGLLLVGMPRLVANLRGKRAEYAQLYSRVRVSAKVQGLSESDTRELVHAALPGSNGVWKAFYEAARIHDDVNTRLLETLVEHASRISRLNSIPVTREVVQAAKDLTLT
jgi:DNA transposition AAA+ family ATPase